MQANADALGAEMIDEPVSFPRFGVGNCLPPLGEIVPYYNIAPENRQYCTIVQLPLKTGP